MERQVVQDLGCVAILYIESTTTGYGLSFCAKWIIIIIIESKDLVQDLEPSYGATLRYEIVGD